MGLNKPSLTHWIAPPIFLRAASPHVLSISPPRMSGYPTPPVINNSLSVDRRPQIRWSNRPIPRPLQRTAGAHQSHRAPDRARAVRPARKHVHQVPDRCPALVFCSYCTRRGGCEHSGCARTALVWDSSAETMRRLRREHRNWRRKQYGLGGVYVDAPIGVLVVHAQSSAKQGRRWG